MRPIKDVNMSASATFDWSPFLGFSFCNESQVKFTYRQNTAENNNINCSGIHRLLAIKSYSLTAALQNHFQGQSQSL